MKGMSDMMKQLTLRVVPNLRQDELVSTYRGVTDSRNVSYLRCIGLKCPNRRYRVRFRLAPKGLLQVAGANKLVLKDGQGYRVCFLCHTGWPEGTKVSRRILPWR